MTPGGSGPAENQQLHIVGLQLVTVPVDVFKSTPFFLEVVPLGVSKGASLDPLLKSMCMTKDNLIACGDSFNDITMIGYAGLGVAMENGEEEVKKVANYIAPSNNDDGVGHVVEEFMLKDEIID